MAIINDEETNNLRLKQQILIQKLDETRDEKSKPSLIEKITEIGKTIQQANNNLLQRFYNHDKELTLTTDEIITMINTGDINTARRTMRTINKEYVELKREIKSFYDQCSKDKKVIEKLLGGTKK